MLSMNEIGFSYKDRDVLRDITLDVGRGSIIALLGCNGVGKSTLMKCICGILTPQSGTITIDEQDIRGMSGREIAKKVGYVPQNAAMPHMSVYDSVLLGRRPYMEFGPGQYDLDIVSDMLEQIGLGEISLKFTDEISGGQFQKVQIARALVQQPDYLILDEPTSALDIANAHRTLGMIHEMVSERDMTTIMSMHDINLAVHYSDLFIFMADGRVEAFGGLDIITPELIERTYGIECRITMVDGMPMIVPRSTIGRRYHDTFIGFVDQ